VQGDEKTKARIRFAVQQWVDAAAPSNFLALNPEALQKAVDTKGESMPRACSTCSRTCRRAMSRRPTKSAFEVGRNVAVH
jgi:polyhydroxyalkanoate synthase